VALELSTARRAGWFALFAGICATATLHFVAPSLPDIYDGLPPPEGPYHYESPPPALASSNQPALSGMLTLSVQGGQVRAAGVQTDDGQAAIFFDAGTLKVPPTAQNITIRIEPLQSTPPQPSPLMIIGNVYRISASTEPEGRSVTLGKPLQVILRTPPGAYRTLQSYDGSHWHVLRVGRVTGHYVTASLPILGDVAATTAAARTGSHSRLSALDLIHRIQGLSYLTVVVALVLVGAVVLIWHKSLRRGC